MLDGVPADLGNKANRLMINVFISVHDTDECTECLPLRSWTEYNIDEDESDDTVSERNTKDEESARTMNEINLPHEDNDNAPLDDAFSDRSMEDKEHAIDKEVNEIEPKEFDADLACGMLWDTEGQGGEMRTSGSAEDASIRSSLTKNPKSVATCKQYQHNYLRCTQLFVR